MSLGEVGTPQIKGKQAGGVVTIQSAYFQVFNERYSHVHRSTNRGKSAGVSPFCFNLRKNKLRKSFQTFYRTAPARRSLKVPESIPRSWMHISTRTMNASPHILPCCISSPYSITAARKSAKPSGNGSVLYGKEAAHMFLTGCPSTTSWASCPRNSRTLSSPSARANQEQKSVARSTRPDVSSTYSNVLFMAK